MLFKFIGIIPSRYACSHFTGKPLANMWGKPMIQHVYERVKDVLDEVFVATDDNLIEKTVRSFGGNVILTSKKHKSSTERCYEAYTKIGRGYNVIVNIQDDKPFIQSSQIELLKSHFTDYSTQIATLAIPFKAEDNFAMILSNKNLPKVILNKFNEAMYFSRSVIPYVRGKSHMEWSAIHTYYKHIGLYAYRSDVLEELAHLPQAPLEIAENLEQLRWLEYGYRIKVAITDQEMISIDTPKDLDAYL
jgi:3-deoxy-manno-octulosonate cytidylyltransferase (CMP-KDO synthetase)